MRRCTRAGPGNPDSRPLRLMLMVAEAIEEDAGVDAIVSSLLSSNPYLHDSSRLCPVASGACLWRPGESAFAPSWPQKVPCQNELPQAQDRHKIKCQRKSKPRSARVQ